MHEVLVNRLGGPSLPRKSVVRLTDRPDMTLDVYCGRKTTKQQKQQFNSCKHCLCLLRFSHSAICSEISTVAINVCKQIVCCRKSEP